MADDLCDRMESRSLELLGSTLDHWRRGRNKGERDYYLITVSFDNLRQPLECDFFNNLPTNLYLPAATVDRLVEAAGRLLRESHDFQRLLRDLEGNLALGK